MNVHVNNHHHRLSATSYESGVSSRQSYHSTSSSSVGSLDRLEESGYSSQINVAELFQAGVPVSCFDVLFLLKILQWSKVGSKIDAELRNTYCKSLYFPMFFILQLCMADWFAELKICGALFFLLYVFMDANVLQEFRICEWSNLQLLATIKFSEIIVNLQ